MSEHLHWKCIVVAFSSFVSCDDMNIPKYHWCSTSCVQGYNYNQTRWDFPTSDFNCTGQVQGHGVWYTLAQEGYLLFNQFWSLKLWLQRSYILYLADHQTLPLEIMAYSWFISSSSWAKLLLHAAFISLKPQLWEAQRAKMLTLVSYLEVWIIGLTPTICPKDYRWQQT